jgi:uracil-DNA glycosylase
LHEEIQILQPRLVVPVGRLAIEEFIQCDSLEVVVGRSFRVKHACCQFDLIPLPHPSGASPWPKIPPGKALTEKAMRRIARHAAMAALREKVTKASCGS